MSRTNPLIPRGSQRAQPQHWVSTGLDGMLQGSSATCTYNRVLPEREDTNHKDTLLPLLNKKFAWRTPGNFDWELAKKFDDFEQLLKFKDQLSAEEGSEVADALESLSASQPKKRACFWKYCI
uniref:Urotensin 2B n=1 Tax=Pavo cristatus TaxID=9049 RepID=A0A8C9F510_PAVCR